MGNKPEAEEDHEGSSLVEAKNTFFDERKDGKSTQQHSNRLPYNSEMAIDVIEKLTIHVQ